MNCYYTYISSLILTCYLIIFFNSNNNNNNNNLIKNNNAIQDNNKKNIIKKNLDDDYELGIEWGQFLDIDDIDDIAPIMVDLSAFVPLFNFRRFSFGFNKHQIEDILHQGLTLW